MDRKQVSLLTAAGLGVATLCAGAAFAFSGNENQQPPRDTLPVGQLVDVSVSSTLSSSAEPPAIVADPAPKGDTVPDQPAPQPAQQQNDAAPPVQPVPAAVVPPADEADEVTPPPPPPTERCWMDDSDPVTYPNGREICEPI